ncbi:AraC family transcriptional regulator [Gallaecimonas pentaromativorans]|uniref:AraC-like DNA-binding protein n=1 Tax=Gallaecimonas pentaromativorans TaxID=584787 RepID=A0A3N1P339_9GAMM|nr:helix-turn-helix domain-containing protein [Gallaecimonas pentaromativorans]ROQ22489.1 AraC-like DNA-binding protein [Gallaecimonas pentaromativorans]
MKALLDQPVTLQLNSLIILLGLCLGAGLGFFMWCSAKTSKPARNYLGALLVLTAVLALAHVWQRESLYYTNLALTVTSLQMALGPLLYLYTCSQTQSDFCWHPSQLWHLLPAVLLALLWQWQLPLEPGDWLSLGCVGAEPCDLLNQSRFVHRAATWVSLLGYGALSLGLLKPYEAQIRACYSDIDGINLAWLRNMIFGFIGLTLFAVVLEVAHWLGWLLPLNGGNLQAWGPIVWSLMIARYGFRQRVLAEQGEAHGAPLPAVAAEPAPPLHSSKYQTSSLTRADAKALWVRLQGLMSSDSPYLEHGLKISELATRLKVPVHHLSETINGYAEQSFYDFINRYRLDEALRLLADPAMAHLSVTDIGFQAGFNSNSTFFAHFKKRFDQTPREYRRQLALTPA